MHNTRRQGDMEVDDLGDELLLALQQDWETLSQPNRCCQHFN